MKLIHTGIAWLDFLLALMLLVLFTYPILGGLSWFIGVLCYRFVFRNRQDEWIPIPPEVEPMITIMVPAHNEEIVIRGTVEYLLTKLNYHRYEVLVVDDGSTDDTPAILAELSQRYSTLRVLHIEKNRGKAHAFDVGVAFAKGELILSNDADTIPEPDALWKYVNYFIRQDATNIAAITANMDVANRSSVLGKSQTVEFSSIVGSIKRTQMGVLGGIYAYSGANTMYRKEALEDVGLFRQDRATEDISIAWDHQMQDWLALFAPDITFLMEVPESLPMLYRQRKRWAKGGTEVWLTNFSKVLLHPFENIGRTVMFIDQTMSILWSFFFWISSGLFLYQVIRLCMTSDWSRLLETVTLAFLFICFEMIAGILQLSASLIIDDHGRKLRYFWFAPWYMLIFWMINAVTIVTTFIPAVKTILGYGSGVWVSPKRQGTKSD